MNPFHALMALVQAQHSGLSNPATQHDTYDPNTSMIAPGHQLGVQRPQGVNSRALQDTHAPVVYPARGNQFGMNQAPLPQGNGQFNLGTIPLQGSYGHGAYPQIGAYGGVQKPGNQFNPQNVRSFQQ